MTLHVARIVLAAQLVVAVIAVIAAVGHAEPAPAAPADTVENRALIHLDRGVAAYRAGDFRRARTELAESNRLAPDRPNPYRWLAMTDVALGDCDSALINAEGFLSRVTVDDPRVGEVRGLRDRCLAEPRSAREPVATAPSVERPLTEPALHPPAERPVYRRWWFWAAIGAVAVAAGTTYAVTRDGPSRLPRVTCDATGCHP